jgi:RecG-like helicase
MMVVENVETAPQSSLERLEAVASTTDGYKLAEMDLMQRGFGELDGSAQTGNTTTIFRNIKLNVTDFLGRKLKSLRVESGERDYNQAQNLRKPMQERLV